MISERPVFDMSDEQIKAIIRANASVTAYSMNDLARELDRRATERHAGTLRRLTSVLVISTVVYTVATLALVIVTWLKP